MAKLFYPGHTACAGCGMAIVFRHVIETLGSDIILVNATSCSEIISTPYPRSCVGVPYIHVTFENAASVASGISRALKAQGNNHTKVVVFAGDGGTYDIGFGALSGMLERNEDVLYVCYDNEAYMNTGNQRSSSTPHFAATTTTPPGSVHKGKDMFKKPIIDIVAAHRIPYVASASAGYIADFDTKLKKAAEMKGSRFIVVFAPCVPGWGEDPSITVDVGKLVVETGIWKMVEIVDGKRTLTYSPQTRKPVEEYFKTQKRFAHLTKEQMAELQKLVDKEWETEKA